MATSRMEWHKFVLCIQIKIDLDSRVNVSQRTAFLSCPHVPVLSNCLSPFLHYFLSSFLKILGSSYPLLLTVLFHYFAMLPGSWGGNTDVLFKVKQSKLTLFLTIWPVINPALTNTHYKRWVLWSRLRAMLVYGYIHKYVEDILDVCLFIKTLSWFTLIVKFT